MNYKVDFNSYAVVNSENLPKFESSFAGMANLSGEDGFEIADIKHKTKFTDDNSIPIVMQGSLFLSLFHTNNNIQSITVIWVFKIDFYSDLKKYILIYHVWNVVYFNFKNWMFWILVNYFK